MNTYNDDAERQLAMQYQNQPAPAKCGGIMDYIRSHKLLTLIIVLLILGLLWWFFIRKKEVNVNVNTPGTINGANGVTTTNRSVTITKR